MDTKTMHMKIQRWFNRILMLAALALTGSGCMVGPNYQPPTMKLSERYEEPGADAKGDIANEEVRWWQKFSDPKLTSLVERAIIANNNIAVAEARLRESRAVRRMAQSLLYPQMRVGASALRFRVSEAVLDMPSSIIDTEGGLFQIGFDAAWAVDLFGGIQRMVESAKADEEAVASMRRGTVLTVAAETARAYLELRGMQRQLEIAKKTLQEQRQTLAVTKNKNASGLASELELIRAKTEVEGTAIQIPPIEESIRQYIHLLSTLLGLEPGALSAELEKTAPLPAVPAKVFVGIPSDLLRRRPDIQAAERELASMTARVGVATAELFPQMVLGGSAGVMSGGLGDLFDIGSSHNSSGYYVAGPFVNWTIFDGGRRKATIDFSEAQVEAAKATYQETVLRAFREVESALISIDRTRAKVKDLKLLSADAQRSAKIARGDYEQGILDQITVLDAQRQANRAQMLLTDGEMTLGVNVVALYKALGGGWETAEPAILTASNSKK